MLLTSNKNAGFYLTREQSRTQFAMWSALAAPLMIGGPVGSLSEWDMETYSNEEVVAVDQDAAGKQGRSLMYKQPIGAELILGRELADGGLSMVFVNANLVTHADVTCDEACWAKTGFAKGTRLSVRDLWLHGPAKEAVAVAGQPYAVHLAPGGQSAMFKFTVAAAAVHPAAKTYTVRLSP